MCIASNINSTAAVTMWSSLLALIRLANGLSDSA